MIHYGRRPWFRRGLSRIRHELCPPNMYLESIKGTVADYPVGCMLCVYDEQETIVDAIKTTRDFVDFYVVVDKNGGTIDAIKEADLDIEAEYHVKPELTLAESRDYALEHLQRAEWILIQDGDEFYNNKLALLTRNRPHTYYRSCKHVIYQNRTMPLIQNGYHNFLLHNNGTIRIPHPNDIPRMTGRAIHLYDPIIWNYHKKNRPKPQTVHYTPNIGVLPPQLAMIIRKQPK